MTKGKTKGKADMAWEDRVLCSDESCIGVIGPDKRCSECGREYEGELPPTFDEYELDADDGEMSAPDAGEKSGELENDTVLDDWEGDGDDPPTDDEWANRILCSDESCIGVVGPDGKCKDCGKPYKE